MFKKLLEALRGLVRGQPNPGVGRFRCKVDRIWVDSSVDLADRARELADQLNDGIRRLRLLNLELRKQIQEKKNQIIDLAEKEAKAREEAAMAKSRLDAIDAAMQAAALEPQKEASEAAVSA
jgi:hypothetical protein